MIWKLAILLVIAVAFSSCIEVEPGSNANITVSPSLSASVPISAIP